jgi:hypothetical protein
VIPSGRVSPDLLAGLVALKATGKGWQTRVNEAMREWLKSHPEAVQAGAGRPVNLGS